MLAAGFTAHVSTCRLIHSHRPQASYRKLCRDDRLATASVLNLRFADSNTACKARLVRVVGKADHDAIPSATRNKSAISEFSSRLMKSSTNSTFRSTPPSRATIGPARKADWRQRQLEDDLCGFPGAHEPLERQDASQQLCRAHRDCVELCPASQNGIWIDLKTNYVKASNERLKESRTDACEWVEYQCCAGPPPSRAPTEAVVHEICGETRRPTAPHRCTGSSRFLPKAGSRKPEWGRVRCSVSVCRHRFGRYQNHEELSSLCRRTSSGAFGELTTTLAIP